MFKICEKCNKEFKARNNTRKYCSNKCAGNNKFRIPRNCFICGKSYEIQSYLLYIKRYCSKQCQHVGQVLNDNQKLFNAIKRFHESYEIKENGCSEWNQLTNAAGYGVLNVHKKKYLAHRFSYFIHRGIEAPADLVVRHLCHNSRCVAINHLSLGTHKENTQDSIRDGRMTFEHLKNLKNKNRGIPFKKGHRPKNALNENIVKNIKLLLKNKELTPKKIANIVGVKKYTVQRISSGIYYTNITID